MTAKLLQIVTILLQIVTILLQTVTAITNCNNYNKLQQNKYQ